ncbi:MAG: hypothetical protein NW224_30095 [Leptolyngbyaceae cyanobacterium bins.302]|nr:hypothetical protein [Leptolyngbyaceae cyanobacterium bins.302]
MNQNLSDTTILYNLSEVNRLIVYIRQHTVDSEQTPICSDEIPTIANQLIQQLVWKSPHLDQVLQELLDELRFRV